MAQNPARGAQAYIAESSLALISETHLLDKTRRCKFHARGRCRRGADCTFAHTSGELMPQPDFYKTQLCGSFIRFGECSLGADCSYAHARQELRRASVPTRPVVDQPAASCATTPSPAKEMTQDKPRRRRSKGGPMEDGSKCMATFSRQSTEEPPHQDSMTAMAELDSFGVFCVEEEEEEAIDCQWRVRRTFLCLEPVASSPITTPRRCSSAPQLV